MDAISPPPHDDGKRLVTRSVRPSEMLPVKKGLERFGLQTIRALRRVQWVLPVVVVNL